MMKSKKKQENCWECEIMQIDGWKYYNRAAIPQTSPHETPDLHLIESGDIWKVGGDHY